MKVSRCEVQKHVQDRGIVRRIGFCYCRMAMRPMSRGLGILGAVLVAPVVLASLASSTLADEALYVANANGPSVYQYAVQEDGSLLQAASVAKTAERPDRLVISPNHKSLYVAQGNTMGVGSLLQYTIQPDGTLTPKEPASLPTEREVEGIAIGPDGKSLYVTEGGFFGNGEVATYAIAPDGSLSATEAPKVSTGDQPSDIAVSPDGKSVYMANWLESTISQYSVQANGSLAPMTPATVATGPQPYQIAVAPDGHSLYVTDEHFIVESSETDEGSVSQFTIGTDGSLTPKTPAAVPAGTEPKGIVINPGGVNLYVADSTEAGHLSQFSISPDGTLAPLTPPAVSAGRQPFGLAVGLDGKHLYVSNSAEYTIGEYEIEGSGTLKALEPQTVRAGEWPMSILLVETEGEPPIEHEEPKETRGGDGPVIESEAASNIAEHGATIEAEIKPEYGTELTYFVEYGTTTSYGTSAPTPPTTIRWYTCGLECEGEDEAPRRISISLGGLEAGTTYHYRLVATNRRGKDDSEDATFTTIAPESVGESLTHTLSGEEKPTTNKDVQPGTSIISSVSENSPLTTASTTLIASPLIKSANPATTGAHRLVKALNACKRKPRSTRAVCDRRARAKYGRKAMK